MNDERKRRILDKLGWIPVEEGEPLADPHDLKICMIILTAALLLFSYCILTHGREVRRDMRTPDAAAVAEEITEQPEATPEPDGESELLTLTETPESTDSAESAERALSVADGDAVWIPTHGGSKYHESASCSGMNSPEQVTKEEAVQRGFTPCKRCYG